MGNKETEDHGHAAGTSDGFGLRRWMIIASVVIMAIVLLGAGVGIWKLTAGKPASAPATTTGRP
jgi:hypothetical protein